MQQLGKYQIKIDTSDLANGDSIASYLVDSAGNLLTSTLVGSDQALDVNVVQSALPSGAATETTLASILSEIQSITQAEDSVHGSGDSGIMALAVRNDAGTPLAADGDYIPLSADANGALRVSASIDFAGDYAEDSAHVSGDIGLFQLAVRRDARTSGTSADGDYASVNVNANGELWAHDEDVKTELIAANASLDAIEASAASIDTSLNNIEADIDSLTKLEDAVHSSGDAGVQALAVRKDAQGSNVSADGDYSSLQTWSEGSLKVVDVANGSILQQQVSVTSTAAVVPASNLANRKSLMLQNTSSGKMWIGSATVTTSGVTAGIELPANSFMELEIGPAVSVYAIKSGGGSLNLNVLEIA